MVRYTLLQTTDLWWSDTNYCMIPGKQYNLHGPHLHDLLHMNLTFHVFGACLKGPIADGSPANMGPKSVCNNFVHSEPLRDAQPPYTQYGERAFVKGRTWTQHVFFEVRGG
jgi:hypothetical protein